MTLQEIKQIEASGNIFLLQLQGFIPDATMKELLINSGKRLCLEPSLGLVLDCHQSKIISLATQEWILTEWLPQLRKKYSCAYKIAIIAPTDYFGKYTVENLSGQIQKKDSKITCKLVNTLSQATEWISNVKG